MDRKDLSSFFDEACAVSLYIAIFFIPVSSTLIESFAGIAFLFFLGRSFTSEGVLTQLLKKERIVLFFFIALAISLINSGVFLSIGLQALFFKWGEYILLYLMITQTIISPPRIKYALASISLGAVLVIFDSFSQLFLNLEFIRHRPMILHANNILAVTGPFRHNNDFAVYLICTLIVILYWVFFKGPQVIKCMAGIVFFLGIFILIHAYSRGGWLSFILAIILLGVLLKKWWFLGFSLLITVILGFKINFIKFITFKDSGRFELWGISWKMIKEHPLLGNGIGTFMAWFRHFSSTGGISYAHNCYLQLWAEAGLISLAIFIFFVFKTLSRGISGYKDDKNPVFLVLSCAAIAFLCHSAVDTFFFSYQLFSLFWVLIALLKGSLSAYGP